MGSTSEDGGRFDELLSAYERAAIKPSPEELGGDDSQMVSRLREAIERLRAADRAMGGTVTADPSTGETADPSSRSGDSESTTPDHIGRFTIVRVLGQGGMGVVYEAEQDRPRRRVALKVVRPGYLTPHLLRRFEFEAEILGRLEHPGIARIYDAGFADTPLGRQPYFAMEFVDGQRLDHFVAQHEVKQTERLRLLERVCRAVHHAHTRGVIHRDLKPANILVTSDGSPKVLDFGIARATESDLQATLSMSDSDSLVGTLPYMAPEQASGKSRELDTTCDVYALGVIAYELLVGRRPYNMEGRPLHEAVRVICEEEPSRLSSIDKSLRGDVETIVAKALEKDKTRRYQTAGELADDIKRHLEHEPIAARPASRVYQFRKFAARHRALVIGTVAVILVLSLGVVGTTAGMVSANRQRARAEALLAESYAQSAKLAIQRGDWPVAATNLQRAIDARYSDPVAMRLGLIRTFQNQEKLEEAKRLSDQLEAEGAARAGSPHRGQALLLRGDLMWMSNRAAARELFAQALSAGVPEAQAHYAKAMLAERVPEAIDELRECLNKDPYYHEATRSITMLLLLMGDLENARIHGEVWRHNFADDPTARLALAVVEAGRGNQDGAKKIIAESPLTPSLQALMREVIALVDDSLDMDRLRTMNAVGGGIHLLRLRNLLNHPELAARRSASGFNFPALPFELDMSAVELAKIFLEVLRGNVGERTLEPMLRQLADRLPTPPVLLMLAYSTPSIEEGLALTRRASDAPSLIRARRGALALRGCLAANQWVVTDNWREDSPYRAEAIECLRAAHHEGPFLYVELDTVIRTLVELREFQLARSVAADGSRLNPNVCWIVTWQAVIEYLDGSYGASVLYARKAVALDLNDSRARTVMQKAEAKVAAGTIGPTDDLEGVFRFNSRRPATTAPATAPATQP